MQADAEHIDTEPREAGDDIAEDGHDSHTAFTDHTAPAGVEHGGAPEDDEEGAIFLGVPSPETSPGLVCPDTAEDGADEAKESGEADDTVDEAADDLDLFGAEHAGEGAEDEEEDAEEAGEEHGGVADRDCDHVGGEPEVTIEHGAHHFHGIATYSEVMGDDERGEADEATGGGA
ncbi:MAG: hypothetical protein RI897_3268 [Verrucomicrobiota bacterium]